jgi:RNA polymerase sigma factor (sigma-70 family)
MKNALPINTTMAAEQNRLLEETLRRERRRLLDFIRKRIPDDEDAEDIVQDVFTELAENMRMERVIERVSGWIYQVARNKIADLFRRRRSTSLEGLYSSTGDDGEERLGLNDLLPDSADGPEAAVTRRVLMQEMLLALDELPEEQRWVFWENEVEDRTFRELSEASGVSLNTLLSRKRYAVLFLRERLKNYYADLLNDNA